MSTLVFNSYGIERVVQHALDHNKDDPKIMLVHDEGVYCMSNGQPRDLINKTKTFVVYAEGCNPYKDKDWYDTARELVGGDDFVEYIPVDKEYLSLTKKWLFFEIHMTSTTMWCGFRGERKSQQS